MRTFKFLILVAIAVLAGFATVYAGSLTPTGTPSATFYTLDDIYYKLTSNASASEGGHNLSTTTSPAGSMHTLKDIYNAITSGGGNVNTAGPFTNNGDGTYTDQHTGITWQGTEGSSGDFATALSYCDGLSLGGHDDWRLPTIKEWQSVADYSHFNPVTLLPNTTTDSWTSTSLARDANYAWLFRVYGGTTDTDFKVSTTHTARCVRP